MDEPEPVEMTALTTPPPSWPGAPPPLASAPYNASPYPDGKDHHWGKHKLKRDEHVSKASNSQRTLCPDRRRSRS